MRIGQAAAVLGITTRTIRHYHHVGVLAEPVRQANGYRDYGLPDLVLLARARRLAELGLSLEEVADVLAEDATADLAEILVELDASLAEQERSIRLARARVTEMQERISRGEDVSTPAALSALPLASPNAGAAAKLDRDLMSLLPDAALSPLTSMFAARDENALTEARAQALYRQMDDLSNADPADPRAHSLAEEIVGLIPDGLRGDLAQRMTMPGDPSLEVLAESFSPAQLAVVRRIVELLSSP